MKYIFEEIAQDTWRKAKCFKFKFLIIGVYIEMH